MVLDNGTVDMEIRKHKPLGLLNRPVIETNLRISHISVQGLLS
jgi:hypothetical protein